MVDLRRLVHKHQVTFRPIQSVYFKKYFFRILFTASSWRETLEEKLETLPGEIMLRKGKFCTYIYLSDASAVASLVTDFPEAITEVVGPATEEEMELLKPGEIEKTEFAPYLFWNKYRYCVVIRGSVSDDELAEAQEVLSIQLTPEDDFRFVYSTPRRLYLVNYLALDVFLFTFGHFKNHIQQRILRNELSYQSKAA